MPIFDTSFPIIPNIQPKLLTTDVGPSMVYLPYWIIKALRRNSLDNIDVLNFDKLSSVLSLHDMAEFACLNQCTDFLTGNAGRILGSQWSWLGGLLLGYTTNSGIDRAKAEKYDSVRLLGTTEEIKKDVESRLRFDGFNVETWKRCISESAENPDSSTPATEYSPDEMYRLKYHRVEILNNKETVVALVLERGVLNALEDRDYALGMVSDLLKARYSTLPIAEASNSKLFELYYDML